MSIKIDRRKKYGVMIDTETVNGLDNPLFYDVGYQIIDSKGNKYIERSFINADIFLEYKNLMNTCYYNKDKLPNYWQDIKTGKRILTSMYKIRQQLQADCNLYNCKFICAHNARFDYKALNGTQRYITKSRYRYFTPYGLEWWDTLAMAKSILSNRPSYLKFCQQNNAIINGVNSHLTKNGKPRFTAEIIYQYISSNPKFVESHTGLEDVEIERQILAWCKRQHKKMKKLAFNG